MSMVSSAPWALQILDANPPSKHSLDSLGVGDIDGDGRLEVITGGNGALLWYRPATLEQGVIAEGHFHVGVALEDLDNDGLFEVVTGQRAFPAEPTDDQTEHWQMVAFKPSGHPDQPWTRQLIDSEIGGGAHDLLFTDIDGDGERELIANCVYSATPALFLYKRQADPATPWHKHTVQAGIVGEGLAVADLDGDGRLNILNGPDWFTSPEHGPFSGPWVRRTFAPSHREMCRIAVVDITGTGHPDIVLVDSEYMDGRLSWFENRLCEDPEHPWREHVLEQGLIYAHSLAAWYRPQESGISLLVAEMSQGGWHAPQNRSARLLLFSSTDQGQNWQRKEISRGEGTHQALLADIDNDGQLEIIGKDAFEDIYQTLKHPKVQIWKEQEEPSVLASLHHRFLDRDKPGTAIEVVCADVDGDGRQDIVCGSWWYHNPTWQRYEIPNLYQISAAYDLDHDGRLELIGTKARAGESHWYQKLSTELYWLKAIDPMQGLWEEHFIGVGNGDWPHGMTIGPLLPHGRLGLVVGYHNANEQDDHPHARGQIDRHPPEIFQVPDDPTQRPWPRAVLADIPFGEEMAICDVNGDGIPDIVAGKYWLENRGDGTFQPHTITTSFDAARLAIMDVNGDGHPDVVLGEEVLDFTNSITPKSRLAWFENPGTAGSGEWTMHVIDMVRCPHSVGIGDLDGDGELEIVCGEHDPFWPYRSQCRLMIYKKADPRGRSWKRYTVDDRFEHHDGARVFEISPGKLAIVSHGWVDNIYLHLWEI